MRLLTAGLDESFTFSHPTDEAEDEEDAFSLLTLNEYDCCIAHPFKVGEFFPHHMRQLKINTPLIMLDPMHDVMLRINLLARGADRVLQIPIHKMELEAYIQALVRRVNGSTLNDKITVGDITLDVQNQTVSVNDRNVHLTRRQYQMLEIKMSSPSRTFSKDAFINRMYAGTDEPQTKIVDVFVCKLRERFKNIMPYNVVTTKWGQGYKITVPKEEAA